MKRSYFFSAACLLLSLLGGSAAQAQWTPVGTPGFSPMGLSNWQHLLIDSDNNLYVSFNDEGFSAGQGTVMRYNGTSWVSVGAPGFTPGISHHSWFDKALDGTFYYSFADGNDMSKAAVMKYNGTAWTSIGSSLSTGECQYSSIKVINDTPYVGFIDNGLGGVVTVLKYTGSSWVAVGSSTTLSASGSTYLSMNTDRHDTLYVAYQAAGGMVNVMKYDGTNWLNVGAGPFLSMPFGSAYNVSLAFDSHNNPYVAYWNPAPMGPSASVQKYDGTSWVNVGSPSFTSTIVNFTSLAFGANDTAYLSFTEATTGNKASVMKFDGTNWVYVGASAFSAGTAAHNSLATDGNGNLYVAYFDDGNGGKTTVMKYQTCTAPVVSAVASSDTLICAGSTVSLTVTGALNDATAWEWHSGSCSGAMVGSGATITVSPSDTTTYYVRGFGGCVASGACTPFTINADVLATPTISASGATLTSSSSANNQWLHSGVAITGATGNTYTVTQTGWYSVTVDDGICSKTSDSVYVIGVGVSNINAINGVNVYPVPCTDQLHVDVANYAAGAGWSVKIYDNIGRLLATHTLQQDKNTIDIQTLPEGMLQAVVTLPEGQKTFKIVKLPH